MLGLPKSTVFGRRFPKNKLLANLDLTPTQKKSLSQQVQAIYWENKIAPSTTNLPEGKIVKEIQVFRFCLSSTEIEEELLRQLDRSTPSHLVYVLEHDQMQKLCLCYKEPILGQNNLFKVDRYFQSNWYSEGNFHWTLSGPTLDSAYEKIMRMVAGPSLPHLEGISIKEALFAQDEINRLTKKIGQIERAVVSERQFKRQVELNSKAKALTKKLFKLKNEYTKD